MTPHRDISNRRCADPALPALVWSDAIGFASVWASNSDGPPGQPVRPASFRRPAERLQPGGPAATMRRDNTETEESA